MSDTSIGRDEYNHGQERIHRRIDEIAQSTHEIGVYAKLIKESVDRMHEVVYEKDGMVSRTAALFERVSLHTKLVIAIILSLIAVAIKALWSNLG